MLDIRKIVTIRDVSYSELGHKPAKPIVVADGGRLDNRCGDGPIR